MVYNHILLTKLISDIRKSAEIAKKISSRSETNLQVSQTYWKRKQRSTVKLLLAVQEDANAMSKLMLEDVNATSEAGPRTMRDFCKHALEEFRKRE